MESLLSVIRSLKGSRIRGEHLQHSSAPASFTASLSLFLSFYILFSLHGARFRETEFSVPPRSSFCTVSFRSNGVQCGRRSLRDCLHTDRGVFRVSFCFQTRAPTLERGGSLDGCRRGWEGRRVAQVHFTRP